MIDKDEWRSSSYVIPVGKILILMFKNETEHHFEMGCVIANQFGGQLQNRGHVSILNNGSTVEISSWSLKVKRNNSHLKYICSSLHNPYVRNACVVKCPS